MLKRVLRSRRGEGYIDVCVLVICAMLVIALAVKIMPVYIAKQQLDTFATELVREAELYQHQKEDEQNAVNEIGKDMSMSM